MSKTYQVGYGKPPQASQFKKGQSGNPKGRQKGSRNLATLLDQELARPVMVTEAGKRKKYRKAELIVRMQVDKAAKGDSRAFAAIQALEAKALQQRAQYADPETRAGSEIPHEAYEEMLAALIEQRRETHR